MTNIRISINRFKKLSADELATFAENVVKQCVGNADYAVVDAFLLELQNAVPVYNAALIDARDKSITAVAHKSKMRATIEDILTRIAKSLEVHVTDDTLVINAGMKTAGKRSQTQTVIPAPKSLTTKSTGNRGELLCQLDLENRKIVKVNALEYSIDNGVTWVFHAYSTRSRAVLKNLPSHQQMQLRARSIGVGGVVSDWTEPVVQAVL